MKIDKDAIRELADLLNETGLTEIEVAEDDRMIRVSRAAAGVTAAIAPSPVFPITDPGTPGMPSLAPAAANASHPGAVTSPMVGTAYLSPEPGAAPFAGKGKTVKAGDTLLIIEAMKVMNPIKAEKGGTVTQVLIEDGQPVEFGDVLVVIE